MIRITISDVLVDKLFQLHEKGRAVLYVTIGMSIYEDFQDFLIRMQNI